MPRPTLVVSIVLTTALASARYAHACSPGPRPPLLALPRTGAADVSPIGSVFLATDGLLPAGLTVEVNGQVQSLPAILALGGGPDGTWWQLRDRLLPGASYVVRAGDGAAARELTRFTTATAYDKTMGAPPKLDGLRLWRVHYPPSAVAAGGCVFAEYEGYLDLDYQPPALPGTPADEVINVLSLRPKNGGRSQRLVWSGSERLRLAATQDGSPVADGQFPSPAQSRWTVELSPDQEYCASLVVYGRGIFSSVPADSNQVCAPVKVLSAPGAPAGPAGPADAGSADAGSGSGCSVGREASPGGLILVALSLLRSLARGRRRHRT